MKSKCYTQSNHITCPKKILSGCSVVCPTAVLAVIAGLLACGNSARADLGNQLANPGFETGDNTGWVTQGNANAVPNTATYYNAGMCAADPVAESVNVYDGTYDGNLYGTFTAPVSYSFYQQTFATIGGSTWSASAYAYASHEDLSGPNSFWIDVTFLDSNNAILAEYQSFNITNLTCEGPNPIPLDAWLYLPVTNQVQNGAIIGNVPSGVLTAPAGTAAVRYQNLFENVNYAGGSVYFDDCDLDLISGPIPPVITNLVPSNIILCNSNVVSYTATSSTGVITNVQVVVTTTGLPGTTISNTVTYGLNSSELTATGLGTASATVNLTIAPNCIYNVTAKATDGSGVTSTATTAFDNLQPTLLWEAEDFNYSSGQWVTTITADGGTFAYANQVGTETIDEHDSDPGNGPHAYRASDAVSVQGAYEQTAGGAPVNRQKFLNYYAANPGAETNGDTVDEEVGYNNVGDWLDYTRNFPAGNYNVYARLATDGSGAQSYFETVTSDATQPNQTAINNGTFSMTDNNWNLYQYVPLLDQYGNLVSVPLSGTQTVRVQIAAGGNPNENFYMIVPAVPAQTPVLQSLYPDGVHPFEPTNYLTFTVGQGNGTAIPAGGIGLQLNGNDVTSQIGFTSTSSNWTGTLAISSNAIYSAVISITNNTHLSSTYRINFDTFSQANYMWEAEDWDFAGGKFIDNPQPTGDSVVVGGVANGTLAANSYYGYPEGNAGNGSIADVDFNWAANSEGQQYRPFDLPGTEVTGDYLRQKFVASQQQSGDPNVADFDLGWFSGGFWMNYTHNYPPGTYYVYGRMAGGAGAFSGTTLELVTSGWGTTTQTTNILGYFADATAAGWQTWHWVPMLDSVGNMAKVTFNGSTNTLKIVSGNNLNVNFMMLVAAPNTPLPVNLSIGVSGSQVNITFPSQASHSYTVKYASSLSAPVVWSTLTTISGDGTTKTATDTVGGTARFYRVEEQ